MVNLFCLRLPVRQLIRSSRQFTYPYETYRLYSDAQSIMVKNEIVPDMIKEAPKEFLKVVFPTGVSVEGGNTITPTQANDQPDVQFTGDSGSFYLLAFIDPDSPSRKRPTYREWHHWLVGNIPGNDVKNGEVLSEYITPCPPRDGGVHRYVFLLFKQGQQLSFDEPRLKNNRTTKREYFKIQKLIDKYQLGTAIAGNFFFAKWDENVEAVYERLSRV